MAWLSDRTIDHLRDLPDGTVRIGDRYELRQEIGRGGMGVVYRAFDRELQREVATKVVNAVSPGAPARLLQEARILGGLEHPGIVPIHDVGTLDDGRVFYVMKLVRGQRLDQHVARRSSTADRLRIFERLCDAVAFAHAHGVIHRDLKPENVMIGAFGEVLVLDWGVAKVLAPSAAATGAATTESFAVEGRATQHGTVLGTPGYMSPEQAAGDVARVDARADVYALGGLLGVLLAGDTDLRDVTNLPRPLVAIVRRARTPELESRYASAQELASEVRRYAAGLPVEAYREGFIERTQRVVARYRTPILLVAAYLAMRVLLLLFAGA